MLETLLGGRYKIIEVLGSGGYGQTYIAEDAQRPGSPRCVVKHLKPASQNETFLRVARRLFQSEAESLQKLGRYDQIPQLLAYFEENQEFYLVQELIEGHPLSHELHPSTQLSQPQVVSLLQDVLGILEVVHAEGVIHRDIKPSNLIRRHGDGKLVLIDFGAVKQIQSQPTSESDQTGFTVAIGTQGYMPNEQLAGKPRFNSDIYALGMLAIQAVTGVRPAKLPEDPETSEIIWRDKAQVSEQLAAILDKMVSYNFRQRYQTVTEVLEALQQLINSPTDRALLPSNLEESAWTRTRRIWQTLTGTGLGIVVIATFTVTGMVQGMRQMGTIQALELNAYDQMMRLRPDENPDNRLLVVGIPEEDIQSRHEYPVYDATLATVLKKLEQYKPRAIGIDIFRDLPQGPGRADLIEQLKQHNNIVAVCKLSNADNPGIPAPPGIPQEGIGFADLPLDPGGTIHRSILVSVPAPSQIPLKNKHLCNDASAETQIPSLAYLLALLYLDSMGIHQAQTPSGELKIGSTVFRRLEKNAGGYQSAEVQDYQILLNYRSAKNAVKLVTLTDVLSGKIGPDLVKDRVVLIGYTAPSVKDYFYTPYSAGQDDNQKMPGVVIHAQVVSQIISAVLDKRPLIWYWPEWVEVLWIAAWAVVGGSLAWRIRNPLVLILSATATVGVLFGACFGIFTQQYLWVPLAAPTLALVFSVGSVIVYQEGKPKQQPGFVPKKPPASKRFRKPISGATLEDALLIQPLSLQPDTTVTTVRGSLDPNQRQPYLLRCTKGQLLTVQAIEGNVNLTVTAPDGHKIGIVTGGEAHWQGWLSVDGDYKIEVSASQASEYTLKIDVDTNSAETETGTSDISTARASLNSDSTSAPVSDEAAPNQVRRYLFNYSQGQELTVQLLEGNANLAVVAPDGQTIGTTMTGTMPWHGSLPAEGDYTIEISAPDDSYYAVNVVSGNEVKTIDHPGNASEETKSA